MSQQIIYLHWWIWRNSIHFALPKLFRIVPSGCGFRWLDPQNGSIAMQWISIFGAITNLADWMASLYLTLYHMLQQYHHWKRLSDRLTPSFHAWLSWVASSYFQTCPQRTLLVVGKQPKLITWGPGGCHCSHSLWQSIPLARTRAF